MAVNAASKYLRKKMLKGILLALCGQYLGFLSIYKGNIKYANLKNFQGVRFQ